MLRIERSSATSSGLMRHTCVTLYSHCSCWGWGQVLPPRPDWRGACWWHYTHIVHVEDGDEFCHLVRTDETHAWVALYSHCSFWGLRRLRPPRPNWWDACGWHYIYSHNSCWVWGRVLPPRPDWWDTHGWHCTHIVHVEYRDEFCHLVRTDETHVGGIVLTLVMLSMGTSSATSSWLMRHTWVALFSHCSCWVSGRVLPPHLDRWDTCGWHFTHIVHVEYGDEFGPLVRTDKTHEGGIICTHIVHVGWGRVRPPRPDWWDTCGWHYTHSHTVYFEDRN
jgi:hypothetical protein